MSSIAALLLLLATPGWSSEFNVEMKTGMLHETYNPNEDKESKLIVEKDGETKTYDFMMGCVIALDRKAQGAVILNCPAEFSGVFIAHELLRVELADGGRTSLVNHVVYLFKFDNLPEGAYIGVRQTKPLRDEKNSRELFALKIDASGKTESYRKVTEGYWLPSDNDLELEGGEEGWEKLEKKWAKLFKLEKGVLLYRAKPTAAFKRFKL